MKANMHWTKKTSDARDFAAEAHAGQVRKSTGRPYIEHPVAVARLTSRFHADENMLVAALLHDVVEDTDATTDDVREAFGSDVASLVSDLTNISTPHDGLRAARKRIDREHTANANPRAKLIKCCDSICNIASMVRGDPNFAALYVSEKILLANVLSNASDPRAHQLLVRVTDRAVQRLKMQAATERPRLRG